MCLFKSIKHWIGQIFPKNIHTQQNIDHVTYHMCNFSTKSDLYHKISFQLYTKIIQSFHGKIWCNHCNWRNICYYGCWNVHVNRISNKLHFISCRRDSNCWTSRICNYIWRNTWWKWRNKTWKHVCNDWNYCKKNQWRKKSAYRRTIIHCWWKRTETYSNLVWSIFYIQRLIHIMFKTKTTN